MPVEVNTFCWCCYYACWLLSRSVSSILLRFSNFQNILRNTQKIDIIQYINICWSCRSVSRRKEKQKYRCSCCGAADEMCRSSHFGLPLSLTFFCVSARQRNKHRTLENILCGNDINSVLPRAVNERSRSFNLTVPGEGTPMQRS